MEVRANRMVGDLGYLGLLLWLKWRQWALRFILTLLRQHLIGAVTGRMRKVGSSLGGSAV